MSAMIEPVLSDDAFLADVREARNDPARFHLWWLGQSGFLVHWRGRFLLFDPYLSDSLTVKYAATDKPHVRMTRRVVSPDRLDFVDVVTSSHNHTDHLDADTLIPLLRANPDLTLVTAAANREFAAQRLGISPGRLVALDDSQSWTGLGLTLHAIPAAHESLDRDPAGRYCYVGFVAEWSGLTLYHAGDTIRYEGMVERLRRWSIDIAFLPINGRLPERRVAGNLWGREAAALARDARFGLAVPCHYDQFEFNTVTPVEFEQACQELGQPYRILRAGERFSGLSQPSHQRHHSAIPTT